jgi:hypothetical protein
VVDELVLRPGRDGTYLVADPARPTAYMLRIGRTDQSYVDLADPLHLEFDYVQRIADLIDLLAPPRERLSVVHVGGAAMTLPRYVAATRPRSAQIVLEPDADLTAFVRTHLPLPARSGIKVRAEDGCTGLTRLSDAYADVVVVDAFEGARVPADLTTIEFLAQVVRVLRPGGVWVVNLTDRGPFPYARRVVAGARATFADVAICTEPSTRKGRRFGNVLIYGGQRVLPLVELASRAGQPPFPYQVIAGERLNQIVGTAQPFRATDVAPSPPAPPEFFSS